MYAQPKTSQEAGKAPRFDSSHAPWHETRVNPIEKAEFETDNPGTGIIDSGGVIRRLRGPRFEGSGNISACRVQWDWDELVHIEMYILTNIGMGVQGSGRDRGVGTAEAVLLGVALLIGSLDDPT